MQEDVIATEPELVYLCEYDTRNICYSSYITSDGSLMACTGDGLYEYSLTDPSTSERLICAGDIMSVCEVESCLYFTECIDESQHVVKSMNVMTTAYGQMASCKTYLEPVDLFRLNFPIEQPTFLTANSTFVIAISKNSLTIFDTKKTNAKPHVEILEYQPLIVTLKTSNELCVTDGMQLRKYCVDNSGSLDLIWTSPTIRGAEGIAGLPDGRTLVSSNEDSSFYIVSTNGEVAIN